LKDAAALCVSGVVFHSLQVGEGAGEVADAPAGMEIVDHSSSLIDFSETAALMANLDLIISVDTAAAHLGGAMGLPTFTLLPFAASHQWLRDRSDSPWYPTMRLIRQLQAGDWASVFKAVATELTGLIQKK
jgi:ADP-heptose:LPS heptosyltransferase